MADQDGQDGTQSGAGATGAQSGTGDAGQTGDNDSGAKGGTQSGAGTGDGAGAGADADSQTELEKLRNRMRAQDQHKAKLELELKQIKDKDLPEAEKLKRDYEETLKQNEKLLADLAAARVDNAFLLDNTHKWRDPKLALKNIDRSAIDVDSDGKVLGMKQALAGLAKDYPFMLEPVAADGGGDGDTSGGKKPAFTPPGAGAGRQNDQQTGVDKNRFPALRRRTGA